MTGIKLSDYAKANGLTEEKVVNYLNKGYLKGVQHEGEWQVFPSPIGLFMARLTDSPLETIKKHKSKLIISSVLIGLFTFNPSPEQHSEVIADQVAGIISEFIPKNSDPFSQLGMQLGARMALASMQSSFSYHNYIFASTMSFGNKTITFGIGGFVFDLAKLDKASVAKEMENNRF